MTSPNSDFQAEQSIQEGLAHFQAGRLHEAESIYQSILKEQPQHPDALHLLGLLKHRTGEHEAAVALIEEAIKVNPTAPAFYNNCGEVYRALHNYDLAIARYEQALELNPEYAEAHYNLGNVLETLERHEEAITRFEQALVFKPNYTKAHNNVGNALRNLGRHQEAIVRYQKALALKPQYAEGHYNLGNALQELDRHEEAVPRYEHALASNPSFAAAHNNLGNALQKLGRHEEALAHHEHAVALKPDLAEAHSNLGNALQELDCQEEAILHYERALELEPEFAQAYCNLGISLQDLGRQEEAIACYEKALAINPDYADAHRSLAAIRPRQEQIPVVEKLLASPEVSAEDAMHYHYCLGALFSHAKSYASEFDHCLAANTLKRKTFGYDPRRHSGFVDRLIETYTSRFFEVKTVSGSDSELPVVIVRMPRSGTTLVEQIVSSHPQVHGAGELDALMRVEEALARQVESSGSYPEGISLCEETMAAEFAAKYLNELGKHSQSSARVTDKMPSDFMRIGLIKILFPHARIIHCERNALDTCSSIFLNYLVKGHDYSFDLEELGQYYLAYDRLMRHWNSVLPNEIFAVAYEDLVLNQEPTSRQLIEHL